MTTTDQLALIENPQFFTDLRTKMQAITAAMVTDSFTIDGEIVTAVSDVPVRAKFFTNNVVTVQVGSDDNGRPLFEWTAPTGWLS